MAEMVDSGASAVTDEAKLGDDCQHPVDMLSNVLTKDTLRFTFQLRLIR